MERFTFQKTGSSTVLTFSSNPANFGTSQYEYLLADVSGLTEAEIIIPTVRGYQQNGYTMQGVNAGSRIVNITFVAWAKDRDSIAEQRKRLCHILSPLDGVKGVLQYYNSDTNKTYCLECVCSALPAVQDTLASNLYRLRVEFTASNPLWRSLNPHQEQKYFSGSTAEYGNITYTNDGDIPSPFSFVMSAPVYRGYIRLTDSSSGSEVIQNNFAFTATALQNDTSRLKLTTDYGDKNLWLRVNGVDTLANRFITSPDFFSIPCAEVAQSTKKLAWGLEMGRNAPTGSSITIQWYDWYLGV